MDRYMFGLALVGMALALYLWRRAAHEEQRIDDPTESEKDEDMF